MNVGGGLTMGEGATVRVNKGTLGVTGAVKAGTGNISLGNGGKLDVLSGTTADNALHTLTLEEGGSSHGLVFHCSQNGYTSISLSELVGNEQHLTITLEGLDDYAGGNATEWDFDLFGLNTDQEGVGLVLRQMKEAGLLQVRWSSSEQDNFGYEWRVNNQGHLSVEIVDAVTWTAGVNGHGDTMTWKTGQTDGRWDGGADFADNYRVTFIANEGQSVTITLDGDVQTGKLVTKGTGSFTYNGGSGTITARAVELGTDVVFSKDLRVVGEMRILKDKTVEFQGASLLLRGEGSIYLEEGASLELVNGGGLYDREGNPPSRHMIDGAGGTVVLLAEVTNGLVWTKDLNLMHFTEGVTLVVKEGDNNPTPTLESVEAEGQLKFEGTGPLTLSGTSSIGSLDYSGASLTLSGTNSIGSLNLGSFVSDEGETVYTSLSLTGGETTITGEDGLKLEGNYSQTGGSMTVANGAELKGDYSQTAGSMTVTNGDLEVFGEFSLENADTSVNVEQGTIVLHKGISVSEGHWSASLNGQALELLNEEDKRFNGQIHMTGDVIKSGAGEQHIYSGDGGIVFEVGGNVTVNEGTLKVGEPNSPNADYSTSTGSVGGNVVVNDGAFSWQGAADLTIGGNVEVSETGAFSMTGGSIGGNVAVSGGTFTKDAAADLTIDGDVEVSGKGVFRMKGSALEGKGNLIDGSLTVGEEARFEFVGDADSICKTTLTGALDVKGELLLEGATTPASYAYLEAQRGHVELLTVRNQACLTVRDNITVETLHPDGGCLEVMENAQLTIHKLWAEQTNENGEAVKCENENHLWLSSLMLHDLSTLEAGGLRLNGLLNWGRSALWRLTGKEKITLGEGFSPTALPDGDEKLRIFLTKEFLEQYDQSGVMPFFNLVGFEWNSEIAAWASKFQLECEQARTYSGLHIDEETGYLVWEGRIGVEWQGENGDVWEAAPDPEKWVDVRDPGTGTPTPEDQDVHFTDKTSGDVIISGEVSPRNVYVESGAHVFTGDGGLNLEVSDLGGEVYVGGDGENAMLTLDVNNVNLPAIRLENEGVLVVSDREAMTVAGEDGATNTTKIKFMGGVLEYSGKALEGIDLSEFVADLKDGSTDKAKVNVSNDGEYADKKVTWGGEKAKVSENGGLRLALDETGIEKSGWGSLTLEWREKDETGHKGSIAVTAGTLELKVHADPKANVTMSNRAEVGADEAVLALTVAEGSRGTVNYAGTLTGDGSVDLRADGGKLVMSGDSRDFGGEIRVANGDIRVSNDKALGGAGTTLALDGGKLSSAEDEMVTIKAGTVRVLGADAALGSTLGNVKLTGSVTGSGWMTAADDATVELSGDVSKFAGYLNTGASGAWILSSGGAMGMSLDGAGVVNFTGNETTFSGVVDGSVTLEQSGDGMLTVTSVNTSEGAKLKGKVTLGNAASTAVWNGGELVKGGEDSPTVITLANVDLRSGRDMNKQEGVRLDVNTAVNRAVNVNGLDGAKLDDVKINEGGQLIGVSGAYTVDDAHRMTLYFGGTNASIDLEKETASALITGLDGFQFSVEELKKDDSGVAAAAEVGDAPSSLQLVFSSEIYGKLRASETPGEDGEEKEGKVWLHLLQDGTVDTPGMIDLSKMEDGVARQLAYTAAGTLELLEDGYLLLSGTTRNLYIVMNDPNSDEATVTQEGALLGKDSVVVLDGKTLTLDMDGSSADRNDPVLHNLLGTEGTTLKVTNAAEDKKGDRVTLGLDNSRFEKIKDNRPGNDTQVDGTTVRGEDTVFEGSIAVGVGVDVDKTGLGTLTVGGNYTLEDGVTTLRQGALVLRGESNSMEGLDFAYVTKQDAEKGENLRGLVLDGGTTTINGAIKDRDNTADGDDIVLKNNANLELKGASELASASIIGDGNAAGTVTLKGAENGAGASLSFTGSGDANGDGKADERLSGVAVQMEEGTTLDIGKSSGSLTHLEGNGTLKSDGSGSAENGGTLTVSGGSFSGTLAASDSGTAGTLAVEAGKSFTLKGASSTAKQTGIPSAWNVKLGKGSNLKVDVSERANHLALGNVDLGDGNMTVDFGNRYMDGNSLEAKITSVGNDGILEFQSTKGLSSGSKRVETGITLGKGVNQTNFKDNHLKFTGVGNFLRDNTVTFDNNGQLVVTSEAAKENNFTRVMPDANRNALAGASMVWDSLKDKSQTESFADMLADPTSDYKKLIFDLIGKYDSGNYTDMERALTSVAGASIATIAPAFMQDLHRQIKAIRNRTTTMASDVNYESYDTLPIWHAWINGEGGYHKLESDGYMPGYTLNNWGGTVGVDVDVTPSATVGLAISAMYGDLKPDSADAANGHMDTTWLSAFLRANSGSWIHTFVVSGGLADINLDRTVNYGSGSYRTKGSTDGYAIGAMYEVGYTQLMNDAGTFVLQPVFNVEVRHANVSGYTESGSDAGLRVDDVKQDLVTFGAGVRMQSVVGTNSFNRTAIFEARALLKADVGDRSGKAKNGMIGPHSMSEVESAEVGALGVEIGAGITIPLGSESGSIFMDASLEYRRGWTSADASVGYRINF